MSGAIEEAAERIRRALVDGRPCEPIRDLVDRCDPVTGYAIQNVNTQRWLGEGRRLVGRKIGLTSDAVQQQMGVDQPDFGMLYEDMEVADGEMIAAGRLLQPRLEGEVAFVLGQDIKDISDLGSVATPLFEFGSDDLQDGALGPGGAVSQAFQGQSKGRRPHWVGKIPITVRTP